MFNDTGKAIALGMLGAFLQIGVEINKIDTEAQIIYITVPERSYVYDRKYAGIDFENIITSPEALAQQIKKKTIELGIFPNCRVKYRTKEIYWTKEMGKENYDKNINKVIGMLQII